MQVRLFKFASHALAKLNIVFKCKYLTVGLYYFMKCALPLNKDGKNE